MWWDIRPHPGFGTVELRICDGLPTLEEIAAVAALSPMPGRPADHQLDRGYTLPVPRTWLLRENKWRAARYGLDAEIIVDDTGRLQPVQAIEELVDELPPVARRLGCSDELEELPRSWRVVRATTDSGRLRRRTTATCAVVDCCWLRCATA